MNPKNSMNLLTQKINSHKPPKILQFHKSRMPFLKVLHPLILEYKFFLIRLRKLLLHNNMLGCFTPTYTGIWAVHVMWNGRRETTHSTHISMQQANHAARAYFAQLGI